MNADAKPLVGAAATLVLTVFLLGTGLAAADRHRLSIKRAALESRREARKAELVAQGILTIAHAGEILRLDPFSDTWAKAPAIDVPVLPQTLAMPTLGAASVSTVRVQALRDDTAIQWRISWADSSRDAAIDVARFSDAAALQFPMSREAPFTMGGPKARVQILQWKAIWQDDVDDHYQDVQDLHPNYWADLYWFATGAFPFPIAAAFADPVAQQWFVAYSAGNPMSDFHRSRPVDELMAEGFGTLTVQPEQASSGRGVWKDGQWAVVFARPLESLDPLDYQFRPGRPGSVGIAIWEGAAGNVGGRKHWSNWIPFEVIS